MNRLFRITTKACISVPGGDVHHYIRSDSPDFYGFGECYFSEIESGVIKGWKMHQIMFMNLKCVRGHIRFNFYPKDAKPGMSPEVVELTDMKNEVLTVPPGSWFAFKGISIERSMLCNVSSIIHSESEVSRMPLDQFKFL